MRVEGNLFELLRVDGPELERARFPHEIAKLLVEPQPQNVRLDKSHRLSVIVYLHPAALVAQARILVLAHDAPRRRHGDTIAFHRPRITLRIRLAVEGACDVDDVDASRFQCLTGQPEMRDDLLVGQKVA